MLGNASHSSPASPLPSAVHGSSSPVRSSDSNEYPLRQRTAQPHPAPGFGPMPAGHANAVLSLVSTTGNGPPGGDDRDELRDFAGGGPAHALIHRQHLPALKQRPRVVRFGTEGRLRDQYAARSGHSTRGRRPSRRSRGPARGSVRLQAIGLTPPGVTDQWPDPALRAVIHSAHRDSRFSEFYSFSLLSVALSGAIRYSQRTYKTRAGGGRAQHGTFTRITSPPERLHRRASESPALLCGASSRTGAVGGRGNGELGR